MTETWFTSDTRARFKDQPVTSHHPGASDGRRGRDMKTINYDDIDPGVREVVRCLNHHGWRTTDSGDGVSKPEESYTTTGCALRIPHVVVTIQQAGSLLQQAYALRAVLRAHFENDWEVDGHLSTGDDIVTLFARRGEVTP